LDRIAALVTTRPRQVVAAILLLTLGLANEVRQLRLEVLLSDEVPVGHPYTVIDDELSARLDQGQTAIVAIGVRDGDVVNPDTLARIRRITDGMAQLPGLKRSSVLSLTATRVKAVEAEADAVRVEALVPADVPADAAALAKLRARILSYPMYVGTLITPDARGAMVLADFEQNAPTERITASIEALAARERDARTEVWVGGQPPALAALNGATRGIIPLVLLALGVIAIVHYEAFRTLQAVFLPLFTAGLSVIWAMGITAALGFKLTPWTAITAVLVLSVAAGHAVQILKRYYECYAELGDNRAAVAASIRRIGPVMAIACGIAAAGFASLATFGIPAVRDFGLMAAFGILSTLVLELTFIPAVRSLLRAPRSAEANAERSHRFLDAALDVTTRVVLERPRAVLIGVGLAIAAASLGIFRLEVNSAFRSWFDADAPVIAADNAIRARFTGTSTIRVLVEGDAPDALLDPAVLRGMAAMQRELRREDAITGTLSLADYVEVMNRALHDGAPDALAVPETRDAVEQMVLLFEPDDLARVASADRRTGAIQALSRQDRVKWVEDLFARLRTVAAREFPPGVRVAVGGGELGQAAANNSTVIRHKLENMAQIAAVIFVLSALVFRSLGAGLFVLAPLACAALVNLGVMGWTGSWLSFATASYTAMGVSIGADFAIYLLFRLREEVHAGRPLEAAIAAALRTSGRAIFFVASAIAAGNATLLASDFALWRQLGGYVALMMTTSSLATLTVVPALALLTSPGFLGRPRAARPRAAIQSHSGSPHRRSSRRWRRAGPARADSLEELVGQGAEADVDAEHDPAEHDERGRRLREDHVREDRPHHAETGDRDVGE
jgi:predicted RND superfamily exporter protein